MLITYAATLILAVQAPSHDSLLALGDRLAGLEPAAALLRFEELLARDSTDVGANWRAAIALNDLALPLSGKGMRPRRDSLLAQAQDRARRAVRLDSANAHALFALGLVLGNTALTRGFRERVRLAVEIRELALSAIAADSALDGAHHLLGRWNYEVLELSGFERFIARSLLGGAALGKANWPEARHELEQAVALDSARIFHRLDLARVYLARRDTLAAEAQLRAVGRLPIRVAADSTYRREARELLQRITGATRSSGSP